jgi:hypothetical protein
MNLYAFEDANYEYALWAESKQKAFEALRVSPSVFYDLMSNQTDNKNLKALITDRTSIYRRHLHNEDSTWTIWRAK